MLAYITYSRFLHTHDPKNFFAVSSSFVKMVLTIVPNNLQFRQINQIIALKDLQTLLLILQWSISESRISELLALGFEYNPMLSLPF